MRQNNGGGQAPAPQPQPQPTGGVRRPFSGKGRQEPGKWTTND